MIRIRIRIRIRVRVIVRFSNPTNLDTSYQIQRVRVDRIGALRIHLLTLVLRWMRQIEEGYVIEEREKELREIDDWSE